LSRRAEQAGDLINRNISTVVDAKKRAEINEQLSKSFQQLAGKVAWIERVSASLENRSEPEATKLAAFVAQAKQVKRQAEEWRDARWDAESRMQLRRTVRDNFGLLEYVRLLQAQQEYLKKGDTTAALDSELAMLRWDMYPRASMLPNYLHYRMAQLQGPGMLMVMRLDAPEPGMVMEMIIASLKAEKEGLKGRFVIDSRGIPASDPKQGAYGTYDEHLRRLAQFVKEKTKMPLMFDERPEVISIAPGG